MVNLMAFARKHLSIRVRQIMLQCARICFFSAPFYGSSHNSSTHKKMRVRVDTCSTFCYDVPLECLPQQQGGRRPTQTAKMLRSDSLSILFAKRIAQPQRIAANHNCVLTKT
jgi:hypothetical protein